MPNPYVEQQPMDIHALLQQRIRTAQDPRELAGLAGLAQALRQIKLGGPQPNQLIAGARR